MEGTIGIYKYKYLTNLLIKKRIEYFGTRTKYRVIKFDVSWKDFCFVHLNG